MKLILRHLLVFSSIATAFVLPRSTSNSSTASSNTTAASMFRLSSDEEFAFVLQTVLSLSNGGGANTGEVLRAASQIVPGDFESWFSEFNYLGNQIYETVMLGDSKKHPVSVREAMFRAATYYRQADFFLHGNQSDPRINALWKNQTVAFNQAISLLPVPGERVTLQADGFKVPAIFYKASPTNESLPTVLVGSGYDAAQEDSYHSICTSVIRRGWNCATYEGPGQPTVRREQNLGFIPDWHKVVTPIVDYFETRYDVDTSRIALVGVSFGGTLAPRAAAVEHRFAAVLAVDGMFNLGAALEEQFPAEPLQFLSAGNKTAFDAYMLAAAKSPQAPTAFRWVLDQGTWSFNTSSPYEWFIRLKAINMEGLADKIEGPVFVGSGQDDTNFLGQPEELAKALRNPYYHFFKTELGAGEHCQIGAEFQLAQVAFDWLDGIFEHGKNSTAV